MSADMIVSTRGRLHLVEVKPRPFVREETYAANLIARYQAADPEWVARGSLWYHEAHCLVATLADQAGITRERALGVAAVLTASSSWRDTIRGLGRAFAEYRRGEPAFSTGVHWQPGPRGKAHAVLNGADITETITRWGRNLSDSYKTLEIWHCLNLRLDHCAIDRWHWRFLVDDLTLPARIPRGPQYKLGVRATERAADALGLLPGDLQQRLWVAHLKERAYAGHIA